MFSTASKPQTTWQVIRSAHNLWKSSFRYVWPFSIGFASLSAIHNAYTMTPLTLESLENKPMTLNAILLFCLGLWIQGAMIDAMHRSRGQQGYRYHFLPWRPMLKKIWVFPMVFLLTMVLCTAGFLCFIIPGIMLSIYLVFSPYLAIIDDRGIKQSIRGSFELSKGYGWFLSNRLSIVALILMLFLVGVVGMVFLGCYLRNADAFNPSKDIPLLIIPVGWIGNAFLYPFMHALILEILYDLRLRKSPSPVVGEGPARHSEATAGPA